MDQLEFRAAQLADRLARAQDAAEAAALTRLLNTVHADMGAAPKPAPWLGEQF